MSENTKDMTVVSPPGELPLNHRQAEINENTLVVKENLLINTPVDYTEHEQKIIALVISQIREQDEDFVPVTFTVEQIADQLEITKNKLYTELDSLTNTINRQLVFPFMRDGEVGFDKMPFFSMINYYNGKITFHINDKLKFVLLGLQKTAGKKLEQGHTVTYSKYKVRYHTKLKGKHVLRFHELLAQHIYKKTFTISLEELKKFLYIENKFPEYKDFKRRVLVPAHQEINQKTNIYFSYEPIKTGNKITSLQFSIFEKSTTYGITKIKKELEFYGLSKETIEYIFDVIKIDFDIIKTNLDYVQKQISKGKIINNIDSYLYSAILKNYAQKSSAEMSIEKKQEEEKRKQQDFNNYLKEIQKYKLEFSSHLEKTYQDFISNEDKSKIIKDFLNDCPSSFTTNLFKKALKDTKVSLGDLFIKSTYKASLKTYILGRLNVSTSFTSYLKDKGIEVTERFVFENGLN